MKNKRHESEKTSIIKITISYCRQVNILRNVGASLKLQTFLSVLIVTYMFMKTTHYFENFRISRLTYFICIQIYLKNKNLWYFKSLELYHIRCIRYLDLHFKINYTNVRYII